MIDCISLWQPWATLMAYGLKRIETRSWPWRGDLPAVLAVHAARKWDPALYDLSRTQPFKEALERCGVKMPLMTGRKVPTPAGLPFGAVLCIVRLVECIGTGSVRCVVDGTIKAPCLAARLLTDPNRAEAAFGNYAGGRYCWTTDRVRRLAEPILERGRQSLWRWEPPREVADVAAGWLHGLTGE